MSIHSTGLISPSRVTTILAGITLKILKLESIQSRSKIQIDTAFSSYWLASASSAWDRANLWAPLGNRGTFIGNGVGFSYPAKAERICKYQRLLCALLARFLHLELWRRQQVNRYPQLICRRDNHRTNWVNRWIVSQAIEFLLS